MYNDVFALSVDFPIWWENAYNFSMLLFETLDKASLFTEAVPDQLQLMQTIVGQFTF